MKKEYIKPNNKVHVLALRDGLLNSAISGGDNEPSTGGITNPEDGDTDDSGEARSYGGSTNIWDNEW